ncbi:MAG: hypothetical protein M0Z46_08025 [Actinomycetota bacterium]|nr:hypothetical protein [Actinomycetota bacterium]
MSGGRGQVQPKTPAAPKTPKTPAAPKTPKTRAAPEAPAAPAAARLAGLVPYACICAAVVAANALYLFGVFDPNPVLSMSGLPIVAQGGVLAGRFTIDPNAGTTALSLGHLAALDLLHGHLPWWNPYEGVGAPLAGEMQSAALFPPTLLLALPGGQLLFHVLLEAVAGMATYALVVRLGTSRVIATGAGAAFALNGTFAWFAHAPVNPIPFLPLLLLGLERARAAAEEGRGGSFGLLALALALSVYAGFPEVAYLDGIFAVVWAAVRVVGLERAALARYARKVVIGAGAGVLCAAPILVAFGDYLRAAYLGPHGGGYDALSIPGTGVGALFFPYAAGPIFGFTPAQTAGVLGSFWINVGGYLTTSILVLAVVGLWSRRLRALRIGLAAWVVVALGRAYGAGPAQRLFDILPIMNRVEAYRYVTPSIELAVVVLAFLGVDDLFRRDVPTWFVAASVALAAGAALATLGLGRQLRDAVASASQSHAWFAGSLAWGFGMLAAVGVTALLARGRLRGALLAGLVVLDACAMFVVPQLSAPRSGRIDTAFVHWVARHEGAGRIFTFGGLLNPNFGSYFEVAEADVNDLPMPKAYARYILAHLDPTTIPNHFDGTTIVARRAASATRAGRASTPSRTPETPVQAFAAGLRSYEAIGVRYAAAYTGSADAAALSSLGLPRVYVDPHAVVYRLFDPSPMYSLQAERHAGRIGAADRTQACTISHVHIDSVALDCRRPAVLVRRELAMAGWTAAGGGRPLVVRPDGPLFQEVTLPKGREVVRFSFVPPHEDLASGALAVGIAALVTSWVLTRRRPRRLRARHRHRHRRALRLRRPRFSAASRFTAAPLGTRFSAGHEP